MSAHEIDHESTRNIVCPYCGWVCEDSWEYNDASGDEIDCGRCEKKFELEVDFYTEYTTKKLDCPDDKHEFGPAYAISIDQETADKWNLEKFIHRTDWKPHVNWRRECPNCEEVECSDDLPLGSPNPWATAPDEEAA